LRSDSSLQAFNASIRFESSALVTLGYKAFLDKRREMRLSILLALMAALSWSTPCTIAAAQTQCVSFSDTIDGVNKDRAVEKSLKSLDEQIEKWKADNGVTGSVTVTAEKPQPHPFWRSSVPSYALIPPDVVSDSAYTICWTGVVSPVVCTSGARVCW
jgi:hypothetical protein